MKHYDHLLPHPRFAALAPALLALTAFAQQPAATTTINPCPAPDAGKAEMMLLQTEPSAAGPRGQAAAALSRADVIRELQRARANGELNWAESETTGYAR